MATALEQLAVLERIERAGSGSSAGLTEQHRVARTRVAAAIESLTDDLGDRAAAMTVLKMLEAARGDSENTLEEALQAGDAGTAAALKKFMSRVQVAVCEAADEALRELKK